MGCQVQDALMQAFPELTHDLVLMGDLMDLDVIVFDEDDDDMQEYREVWLECYFAHHLMTFSAYHRNP